MVEEAGRRPDRAAGALRGCETAWIRRARWWRDGGRGEGDGRGQHPPDGHGFGSVHGSGRVSRVDGQIRGGGRAEVGSKQAVDNVSFAPTQIMPESQLNLRV